MAFFEEDPAADFMAREQESIGDVLGSDNFEMISGGVPTSDQSLDFIDDAPAAAPPAETAVFAAEPAVFAAAEPPVPVVEDKFSALSEAAEPESIRLWKQKQAEEIAARDAEAEAKAAEWKAEAAKELENWHAKQNDVFEKTKAGNREA